MPNRAYGNQNRTWLYVGIAAAVVVVLFLVWYFTRSTGRSRPARPTRPQRPSRPERPDRPKRPSRAGDESSDSDSE